MICDVDFDLTVLEDPDVVEVMKNEIISNNDIEVLENALKNADILNDLDIDVNLIKAVVADVLDVDVDDITVVLRLVHGHAHCNWSLRPALEVTASAGGQSGGRGIRACYVMSQ